MKKFASLLALLVLPQLGLAQQLTSADELQRLVAMPLKNIFVEYPNKTSHIQLDNTELGLSPRDLHPAFYGSFDWHSSVHSHWMLVEVLATQPQLGLRREIIAALDAHLTAEKMRGEAAYFDRKLAGTYERTYGWAWLLQLSRQLHLLTRSEDAELSAKAKGWSQAVDILADKIVAKWKAYLPKMHYPNRIGTHSNSAFALGFALDYARERGDRDFETALIAKARELYLGDKRIPAHLEPNATDFISPALMTADLMTRVLEPAEYRRWLSRYFTPEGLDRLCQPLVITDLTDYTIVHLVGLSFTRAWTMARVARALPQRDKLRQRLERMAPILYRQGMEQIFASGYGGDHWLASFARYADEVLQGKQ